MDVGFGLPVSGSWATPGNIVTIAQRAEELGYAGLWTFQRLLVAKDQDLGPVYRSVIDPIAAMSFAAAVTERIRLGAAVVNVPFASPALLAKQFATIDLLSGGRAVAGVGLGWMPEEFAAVGVPYERRGARGEEYIACLRAMWGPDPVEFEGEFYRVPPASLLPKPVQRPGPPILVGGTAPAALERTGRLADGWISGSRMDPERLFESVDAVKAAATRAGRDPDLLRFACRGVVRDVPRSGPLTGTLEEVRADLPAIAAQGITELFVDLNFDPAVADPDADPAASMRRALEVLEALAP